MQHCAVVIREAPDGGYWGEVPALPGCYSAKFRRLMGRAAVLMLALWLLAGAVWGQTKGQSASDLVNLLTHESSQTSPAFTCGSLGAVIEVKRDAARSLAGLGAAALPAIDEALDSISRDGMESRFVRGAGWLPIAYAKIKGPAAFPRLRSMIDDLRLESFHPRLDSALAVALGLTSYIGGTVAPRMPGLCERRPEPRASLDQLIFALDRNDQRMLEENLGPIARAALDAMLEGEAWSALRLSLGHGASAWGDAAVGYRFETPGRWSEPDETLAPPELGPFRDPRDPLNPEINAVFVNRYGAECGRFKVKFLTPPLGSFPTTRFLIDNADLLGLLRVVASCAMGTEKGPDAGPGN